MGQQLKPRIKKAKRKRYVERKKQELKEQLKKKKQLISFKAGSVPAFFLQGFFVVPLIGNFHKQ